MELIYQLFVVPSRGMRQASEGKKLPWACLVVLLAILSSRIGGFLMLPETISATKPILALSLAIDFIVVLGILFFLTAIFHLVAGISGGKGEGSSLYTVLSLSLIPFWVITPLAITLRALDKGGFLFFLPFWLIISGWTTVLFIIGIREVYHFSWGKTAAIFISPLAGISIALITLFLLFLAILFLSMANIFTFPPFALP
ncbi:YIP1 family protein [candidate division NPL-UPA2 bacterium]|nr:YIP1 family protein [candidate division NPL-UPA2 bacterium]